MLAEEMGSSSNRGSIIWVLASSRPDLIEVDLKRPGRVDVKIPLFPTSSKQESFDLLGMLLKKRGIELPADNFLALEPILPLLLTPSAAEALAVKIYRLLRTSSQALEQVLFSSLREYQHPISPDVMQFQIRLAVSESSDLEFAPALFRPPQSPHSSGLLRTQRCPLVGGLHLSGHLSRDDWPCYRASSYCSGRRRQIPCFAPGFVAISRNSLSATALPG
jgi:hypothetical protein